jgi:phosphoserine aminotransferase
MLKPQLKPQVKPNSPYFSTGPTAKFPGYNLNALKTELLGRSHRSKEVADLYLEITKKIKALLNIPADYKVILTPGSDTGAFEMALWNLVGANKVDLLAWDYFGYIWENDLKNQLKIKNLNIFKADFGEFPNINNVDFKNNDVIFTYCGTTSGVIFNKMDLIPENRTGLIITDATSFVFSEDIPWQKIDALTFSWQKCLGGEAQSGVLVLSPKALERLEKYTPAWPIPQLLNLKHNGQIKTILLDSGYPINTPSVLSALDYLLALNWCENSGGLTFTKKVVNENFELMKAWIQKSKSFDFVPQNITYTSKLSICLKLIHPKYLALSASAKQEYLNKLHTYFATEKIAYDIKSHHQAPLGIRIWAGPTVKKEDLELLTLWLDYYISITLG